MSAISLGHSVKAATGTDATTHTTATFTPTAAQNFVLIVVTHTHGTSATAMTAPTGAALSNMQQIVSFSNGATRRTDIWCGLTTGSASTVVTHYNETATGAIWTIQEFLNVDTTRGVNNLINGIVANEQQANGTGTTATLNQFFFPVQHASNALIAVFDGDQLGLNSTPEAGWTEVDDQSVATPTNVHQVVNWRIGTDLTPSTTFASSETWVGFAFEIWADDASGNWSALETFTKANGANWGDDQSWDPAIGSPTVLNNRAGSSGVGVYANGMLSNDCSTGNNNEARVKAAVMTLSGNSVIGVRLRCHTSTTESYEFIRVGATTLAAFTVLLRYRNNAGVYTTLAGPTTIARATLTTAEELYMTVVGSTLTCYLDGDQVLAATNATLGTSRNRGGLVIRASATNDTLADDFRFGDLNETLSPVTFVATVDLGRQNTKALLHSRRSYLAKIQTASKSFGTQINRIGVRYNTRLGHVSNAKATSFTTLVEGFNVKRPLLAKAGTASKCKAVLTTQQKELATKLSNTFAGGGLFNPAALDVHSEYRAKFPAALNITDSAIKRSVGLATTNVYGSNSATGNISGLHVYFNTTISIASSIIVNVGARSDMGSVSLATANDAHANLTFAPIIFYFHNPVDPNEDPPIYPYPHIGNRLMKFYRSRPAGINVYIYSNGTVSTSDPDGYSTLWRESDRTSDTLIGAPHVVHVYWGGHDPEMVEDPEKTILINAGYDVSKVQ